MSAKEMKDQMRQYFNEHCPGWELVVASAHNGEGCMQSLEVHAHPSTNPPEPVAALTRPTPFQLLPEAS